MSSRENTLSYAKSLACLPTLDAVSRRLYEVLDEKKITFSRLLEIVQYDPALSSRIISVANSAWHSRGVPVVSLRRAMTVLGLDEVKSVLLCSLFYDGVLKKLGLRKHDFLTLWRHSLIAAFTANALCGEEQKEAEKAFTAGLFHDIGKVPLQLLYHYDLENGKLGWDEVCADERQKFETDHQEIGFYMATEWKLPEEYRQVIRLHHEETDGMRLTELVKKANIIMTCETEDAALLEIRKTAQEKAADIMNTFSAKKN